MFGILLNWDYTKNVENQFHFHGGNTLLKQVLFLLKKESMAKEDIYGLADGAKDYLRTEGYESWVAGIGDSSFDWEKEVEKESLLIATDSADAATALCDEGYFCIGFVHRGNEGEEFKGLKYVFSEIDDVEADSFVKAYQRYAGEPWDVIRTDRLMIRETTVEDVDEFYRIYKDPEITQYMEGLFDDPADEKRYQKDYIEKVYGFYGFGVWTLVRRSDNRIIGRAGFSMRNGFDEIELGFLIGKEFQRQGYAYEACKAILDYGRYVLMFEHVQTLVKKENEASIQLCEKLGFRRQEEVDVEENIYGRAYNKEDRVSLSEAKYGKYVKFVLDF